MPKLAGNLNSIDVHFLVVLWVAFSYVMALSVMFIAAPGSSQYFYSLINDAKIKNDAIFVSGL